MLFNERIDALAATIVIANLDGLAMVAEMNAGPLSGVIFLNVVDPHIVPRGVFWRLLAKPTHNS